MKRKISVSLEQIIVSEKTYRELPTPEGIVDLCAYASFANVFFNLEDNQVIFNFVEYTQKNEFTLNKNGILTPIFSADILFEGISFFQMSDRDSEMPIEEDTALDYYVLTGKSSDRLDFFFVLHSGREIYISAKKMRLIVDFK